MRKAGEKDPFGGDLLDRTAQPQVDSMPRRHSFPKQTSFIIQCRKIWQDHSGFGEVKISVGKARNLSERKVGGVGFVAEASLKPWYPKGFNEFSDGVAWRWQSSLQ